MTGVGVGFGFLEIGDAGGRLIGIGLARGCGVGEMRFLICAGVGVGVARLIGNGDGAGLGGSVPIGFGVGVTIGGLGPNRCRVADGLGGGVRS
jgi:hypothetical protein